MPTNSSSLITFRVSAEEHDMLRAVANYSGDSLSAFIRVSVLATARQVLKDVGVEAVMEGDRTYEKQRESAAQRKLQDRLDRLREQAGSSSSRDPRS